MKPRDLISYRAVTFRQSRQSIKNRDRCKTQPKTASSSAACMQMTSIQERHELLLFWFYNLMSHSFYIHTETSVRHHPLPSLPSFIYLLCSGIAVSTFASSVPLLQFPSSVSHLHCGHLSLTLDVFIFPIFPSNLFLY